MIVIISLVLVMVAMFGFALGFYFALYRINLPKPLRLPGGFLMGSVVSLIMTGIVFLIIWPPASLIVTIGGAVLASIITVLILAGGSKTSYTSETGPCPIMEELDGSESDAFDRCGLDFDR